MMPFSRRHFIETMAKGSLGLAGLLQGLPLSGASASGLLPVALQPQRPLLQLSEELVAEWGQALLQQQVLDKNRADEYGGLWCPANKRIQGRVGDAIYPFLHLAHTTKDHRYADGAVLLYRWMEKHVSQEDGSWLNEPVKGAWKGTTVFTIIALCDALHYHGDLLDHQLKAAMETRLKKAGDFVYHNFTISYGNINYPISAAYALNLLGEMLDIPAYTIKGKELAHQALPFFTFKDRLLSGEGDSDDRHASPKGCYAVDLGYNIEESLPGLAMYALLTGDKEVEEVVVQSLKAHAQFMLPDGGWDNSWGTRNYKWTYWGSRTSDGCQPAYALMAGREPVFYQIALKNTEQLQACTHNGLLYGGPHCHLHGLQPDIHHTFCHIRALTTILDRAPEIKAPARPDAIVLPRASPTGSQFFADIQTWLLGVGGFRATITGYDREYKKTKAGHATGGALTMLWHEQAGPLLSASMTEYQLIEAGNQQVDTDPCSICLTPRMELLRTGELWYTNINDLSARIEVLEETETIRVNTQAKLVNKHQQAPVEEKATGTVTWTLSRNQLEGRFVYSKMEGLQRVVFPVVSPNNEESQLVNDYTFTINNSKMRLRITSSVPIRVLPTTSYNRVFNYVPGFEAVPLVMEGHEVTVKLEVLDYL